MYDVLVVGGGIIGCAILRELARYKLSCALLEKEEDLSCGCSKANSGIIHAGYDAETGTLKAKFNVEGNKKYFKLAQELGVPCKKVGSLVLAHKEGLAALQQLLARGIANGVEGLEIVDRARLLELEPNVADDIEYALYADSACIVSPYEMTIALAEQAVLNGAEVFLNREVTSISRANGVYTVSCNDETYTCKLLINCAGYGADKINRMAAGKPIPLRFARGDYFLMDSVERVKFNHVCFPLPDENGKGVLIAPTADGNVIVGPTSLPVAEGDDTAVTAAGLAYVRQSVSKMMRNVNFGKVIRVFAGVRAISGDDFVLERDGDLITVAGICSPGLSSAPAIAEYVATQLVGASKNFALKNNFIKRPKPIVTRELTTEQWQQLIKKQPAYAKMVCRCEKITEGEILSALASPIPPRSLDALKRRVRVGMGRCQGGFCTSRVMDIVAKYYKIGFDSVTKKGDGSQVVVGKIKETYK